MAAGTPLTPKQLAKATEAYRARGSFAAAGRAIGHDRSVVRRALLAAGVASRHELHAQACAKAERQARSALAKTALDLRRDYKAETDRSARAAFARAQSDATRVLMNLNSEIVRRERDRAQTEAIKRGTSNDGAAGEVLVIELPARGGT